VLFDRYGIFEPFLVCTALALCSAALVFLFLEEPKQREQPSEERLQLSGEDRKALALACSIMGALFSPYVSAPAGLKLSASYIGALLSTLFMVFAVLQLLLNRVMTLVGDANLARAGLVLCACGLVVLSFATGPGELVLMSVLLGAGLGAVSLGTLTMASRAASESEGERAEERVRHGKVMGIYYTAFYAGLGGIPLVCGALSEVFGAQTLFLAYALLLLVVMLFVWRLAGRSPERSAPAK
jgi:MFS family permease